MPTVQLPNVKLYYEREGSGQPLLLIMGIGAQMVLWPQSFRQALIQSGFELIKIDNRDVGLSSKMIEHGVPKLWKAVGTRLVNQPVEAGYTLEDMSQDIIDLLDHLGLPKVHVTGISMGSMIAQVLAGKYPNRVQSLTLMHSNTGKRRHLFMRLGALRSLLSRGNVQNRADYIDGFAQLHNVIGSPKYQRPHAELLNIARQTYDRSHHPPGFKRQAAAVLATGDREPFYRTITCPTSVIHGKLDPLMPMSGAKMLVKSIPRSKAFYFDDLAHDIPDHFAQTFAQIISETAHESTN